MRRLRLLPVCLAVLATALIGCADGGQAITDRLGEVADDAMDLSDRARFCLAITRATTAIESGSPATAQEAADEVLAQAPEGFEAEAQAVVDHVNRALAEGDRGLRDEDLADAAEQLRESTLELCDP